MGFFRDYRQRRVSLTGPESVATLNAIEWFFQGGRNWTQGAYHRLNGNKCLVGAVQAKRQGAIEDARYWLRQAIVDLHPAYRWLPVMQIEAFNDSHSFAEVARVIERAKELATGATRQSPVAELPPPQRRPALAYQPQEQVKVIGVADMERVALPKRRD
jgi:hypothetical protein